MDNLAKSIFISWTSKDKIKITEYVEAISKKTNLSYYFSDNHCIGNFEEWFENSISNAPFFLTYITKDSVTKEFCQKEVKAVIKKYKKYNYKFVTFISELTLDEVNQLEDTNPFYQLINECKVSGVFTSNKDFESIAQEVSDKLKIMRNYYDLISYSDKLNNELDQFMILGDNKVYSLDEVYIDRVLLDEFNKEEVDEQTILDKKNVLIKGEAGSGKTLYVKKLAKKLNKEDGYVFILQNNDVKKIIETDVKIIDYLYKKIEPEQLSLKDFQIIMKNNKNYIIVEGLDEVISNNKNKLITKLTEFKNKYGNFYFIYTSRNDENINDCFKVNISPLNKNQIKDTADKYIHIYANEDEKEKGFYLELEQISDEIKSNPLLLSQLAYIYGKKNELPNNKFELYDKITNLIIKDLNIDTVEKNINDTIKKFIESNKRILSKCAYNLVVNKENNNYTFYEALANSLQEPDEVDDIYKYLKTRCIITTNDEFYHKTFLEYFASLYIFNYSNSFTNDDILGYIPNDKLTRIISQHDISEIYEMLLLIIDNKCAEEGIKKSLELIVGDETNRYFHLLNVLNQKKIFGRYLLKPIYEKVLNKEAHPYHELLYYTVKNSLFTELLSLVDSSKNLNYQYAFIQDIICLYSDINILELKKEYLTNINKLENDNTKRYKNLIDFYDKGIVNLYFYYEKDEYDIYKVNDEKLIGHIIVNRQNTLKGKVTRNIIGLSVLDCTNFEKEYACYYNKNIQIYILPFGLSQIGIYFSEKITKVVIPNSVKNIGNGAFSGCSLTSITIPNGVTSIGDEAFSCCSLTSIKIPDSVKNIGNEAFSFCSLTSITIPNSVISIGNEAFSECENLTSITIPNSVKNIGNYAFLNCRSLLSIIVDENNKVYDSRENCNAIIETSTNTLILGCKNTKIPNSVESIGIGAFSGCTSLTSITIPDSVKNIGEGAFYNCSSLTSIEIPNSVESIGNQAFQYCKSLTSIEIPSSVTYISKLAFSGCESLTSIKIPNSVESIGDRAFSRCDNLSEKAISRINAVRGSSDLCDKNLTCIEIPNSVKNIGNYAFSNCRSLTSIKIPDSVKNIGEEAFYNCNSLTSIKIPNSVESIGAYAFSECENLTSIEIPNSVKSIGENAFNNCNSLTSIKIPNSVKNIGENAFYNCSSLTSIGIPNGVKSIGDWAFSECVNLTSIEIPNSVTYISKLAFSGCFNIEKLKISENFEEDFPDYFDSENIIKRYIEKKYRKEDGYIIFD